MSLKLKFVEKARAPGANIAALCREYRISRQMGHKWLRRYHDDGPLGLVEQSRRPRSSPLSKAEDIVAAIVELRDRRPSWGPEKIRAGPGREVRRRVAIAQHGRARTQAARQGETATSCRSAVDRRAARTPRRARTERTLDHRLQGLVEGGQRADVRAAHRVRCLQPVRARGQARWQQAARYR